MLRKQEGNCRSGVALAMRHKLCSLYHLRTQRPKTGRMSSHACDDDPIDCVTFVYLILCLSLHTFDSKASQIFLGLLLVSAISIVHPSHCIFSRYNVIYSQFLETVSAKTGTSNNDMIVATDFER